MASDQVAPPQDRLATILVQAKRDRGRLDSAAMGPFSLTTLGIASVVGAGIFVTTGAAAAEYAGPGVVISFVLAGIVAALTALCYAELAAMIPIAGSTYSYAYAAFGVFVAWFIGWDLLLEYLFAASTVAVGWAGYFVSFLDSLGIHVPHDLADPPFGDDAGMLNVLAIVVVAAATALLVVGTRQSAGANNAMVVLKMAILLLVVAVGALRRARELVAVRAGERGRLRRVRRERRRTRRGRRVLRLRRVRRGVDRGRRGAQSPAHGADRADGHGGDLDGALRRRRDGAHGAGAVHRPERLRPDLKALEEVGPEVEWLDKAVDVAAVVGLFSTVLVTFYGQTRILMRMSADGMLPRASAASARASGRRSSRPCSAGSSAAIVAGAGADRRARRARVDRDAARVPARVHGRDRPAAHPPRGRAAVPRAHVWFVAGLGILSALALMAMLPLSTWIRLVVWLLIGLTIFFTYARTHTRKKFAQLAAETEPDSA